MSSCNYQRNKTAIEQFRKELRAMLGDIEAVDAEVLNCAVNQGVSYAKRHTPVVSGFLRKNWHKLPAKKISGGIETEMLNTAEYASYWNYGHRIVKKKGGPTLGFVKGTYLLEKSKNYVYKRLVSLFQKEIREVNRRYGK